MLVRTIASAGALSLIILSAQAQSYNPENVVRGVCRPDGCDDFTIASIEILNRVHDGGLARARVEVYHSSFRGRVARGVEERYAFCSNTRPAIAEAAFGRHVAFFLAPPGTAREARDTINYYALYFAICHGVEAGRAAAKNKIAVAKQFGYQVGLDALRSINVSSPEEITRLRP
jgi:hypothetical protein